MHNFQEEKQNKQLGNLHKKEEEGLVKMLAQTKYNIPYINLANLGIDNEALRSLSEKDALDLKVAPFHLEGNNIMIALRSPSVELLEFLTKKMEEEGLRPMFYMASMGSLQKVWKRYEEISLAEKSKIGGIDISAEVLRNTAKNIRQMEDISNMIEKELSEKKRHTLSRVLEIILAGAISIKASDVHIEPEEDKARVRLRLDGVLQDVFFFKSSMYRLINSRIKLLSGMKLSNNKAQDGRFSIMEKDEELSIRTSLIPGAYGESIVMRILDPKSIQIELEEIGIEPYLFSIIKEEIVKPNGLILITGPTGSGKTTTLYAFLRRIYNSEIKIITIEDPIEYHLKGITQTQTNEVKDYGFLEGLRSALRQDPDIVMIGEIRDTETAKVAVQASLTGHMVFSTLHTNNAAGVIPRLIDLGVNAKIMVSALSLSIAQRLVRKLCDNCKKEKIATESEINKIKRIINEMKTEGKNLNSYKIDEENIKLYEPIGCDQCHMIGYKGRIGIFEAIKTDKALEEIIPKNPSERDIKNVAKKQGILNMRQDGIVKILDGITSLQEVESVVDLLEE